MEHNFRKIYRPVQPAISPINRLVTYSEQAPHPALANYVYCYWRLQSTSELSEPFSYRVIPDGCIDIFVNLNNIKETRIMGFSTGNVVFDLDNTFDYIGVRFMPGSFPHLFGVDASTLKDRNEDLFDVVPSLSRHLTPRLCEGLKMEEINSILDSHFLKIISNQRRNHDSRLYNAIHIVLQSHGNIDLYSELDTGISPRQLRRLFEYYIGDTPKMFSRVVRFQYLFQLLSARGNYSNKVFLDAGYYDQPHFNKEFKAFFGLTPGQVLS